MTEGKQNKITALISALRPQQWIKNGFVLAPLVFSGQFKDLRMCVLSGLGFLSFCAVSSATYMFNDLCDRSNDLNHPVKKQRPIASGIISVQLAVFASAILIAAGFALALIVNYRLLAAVTIYAGMNVLYSVALKHVVILDVMVIAAGFVLRILAGSVAVSVMPSHWLVLCTIMISLFLGFTKRRAELTAIEVGEFSSTRTALENYSVPFLDQLIAIVTGATIICYALYTVDECTLQLFGTRAMLLTVPPVMYGIFRYLYLTYHLKHGEDPTEVLIRDLPTIINLIIWLILALLVVVYGEVISGLLSQMISTAK
ncbi:MAG: decaprenyl-phosphate phosphoribosyltransferase [Planctomycetota bacterium]|jgi:4-hydroxybenzoate polyprenyltransferase